MRAGVCRLAVALVLCTVAVHLFAQSPAKLDSKLPDVPRRFTLDMEEAARLRPQLTAQSVAASGRYAIGRLTMEKLAQKTAHASTRSWQLRMVEDGLFNAYSSADGTVYVESGLAQLAGSEAGLWAAILSHEIAHIERRDWARRYLYQKSLEREVGQIALGDPAVASESWSDSAKASASMGQACRQIEVEADREGLMLMAHAGYHPDFVPALHHLLQAQLSDNYSNSPLSMHPCWQERDQALKRDYTVASIEFERLWPEWYISPGGNPPVVVFAEQPALRKNSADEWLIQVPIRCQNLAGAVDVVLRSGSGGSVSDGFEAKLQGKGGASKEEGAELRQSSGCTSPRTTITFKLGTGALKGAKEYWMKIYVFDAKGSVLARADVPQKR
ncbi:MAG TPA: M48 family metallopeptidase [Terriglobales bacterium]|nr:M48 family metallopeptidase [Terriglobales bacterium]